MQEVVFAELLAGGRLVLGLGAACQYQEFSRFGIEVGDATQITIEMWDVLEQGLSRGYVEYEGRFVRVPHTALAIRPIGLGLPDIFIAGSHPDMIAQAALRGCTTFLSFGNHGLKETVALRDTLAERWQAGGGLAATMPLALYRNLFVTDDASEARHVAACLRNLSHTGANLNGDAPLELYRAVRTLRSDEMLEYDDLSGGAIIGTPAYCVERLQMEIEALRPTHLACNMGFAGAGRQQTLASLERFSYEVVPQIRASAMIHEGA